MVLPTTRLAPPEDTAPLDAALADLASFDWIAFTSARAVQATADRPGGAALRRAPPPRIAAVGRATAAALAEGGLRAEVVPARGGARALVEALLSTGSLEGQRVLWPRSEIARQELGEGLRAAGATVVAPVAYRTLAGRPEELARFRDALLGGRVSAVLFLSPSAAGDSRRRWASRPSPASPVSPSWRASVPPPARPSPPSARRPAWRPPTRLPRPSPRPSSRGSRPPQEPCDELPHHPPAAPAPQRRPAPHGPRDAPFARRPRRPPLRRARRRGEARDRRDARLLPDERRPARGGLPPSTGSASPR
jgi:hypothetical protein